MMTSKTHEIRIAADHEESAEFVAWLRTRGHDAAISDSSGNYIDGAWTSVDGEAADVLRQLWDAYSNQPASESVVLTAVVGHEGASAYLVRDGGEYRWVSDLPNSEVYATAEAAVNALAEAYSSGPLAWIDSTGVTAHPEDVASYALARAYDAGIERAREGGHPLAAAEAWALDGLDPALRDAASVAGETAARQAWTQGIADELAWLATSVWSPRGVLHSLAGDRDYQGATSHATCRTCGRTFAAPERAGVTPTKCAACAGVRQAELAALLGVTQSAVSQWLAGQAEMSRSVRLLALAHLGVLPTPGGCWRAS